MMRSMASAVCLRRFISSAHFGTDSGSEWPQSQAEFSQRRSVPYISNMSIARFGEHLDVLRGRSRVSDLPWREGE